MKLAERLLQLRENDKEDVEMNVLSLLRSEFGCVFTSDMENMLADLGNSLEITKYFRNSLPKGSNRPSLSVKVLQASCWPSLESPSCVFPSDVNELMDAFSKYYQSQHTSRSLDWLSNKGSSHITVSYKEISDMTMIPDAELRSCMDTLAPPDGKGVLIRKDSSQGDIFTFNDNFACTTYKVDLHSKCSKLSEPKNVKILEKLKVATFHHLDAAVVRIMKSRKLICHEQLVALVIEELRVKFLITESSIKERIKVLMDQE